MSVAPTIPLGQILKLQRGFDITKAQQRPGPIPVVSSSGIQSYHDEAMVNRPGVVIGRKGSLGTCFYFDEPHWPHDTTLWVKDFKGNDPRFCCYLLQTLDLKRHDVGSANPTLNRNHVHLLDAPSHSLPAQKVISATLAAYDDLIDVNRRRVDLIEQTGRELFEEWFGRLRFPGHEASNSAASEGSPLPPGWRRGVLSEVAEQSGESFSPASVPNEELAHFSIPAFDANHMPAIELGSQIMSNKLAFQAPAILVSKLNPRIPRLWFVLNASEQRAVCSTEFVPLRPIEPYSAGLVHACVNNGPFNDRLRQLSGGTSTSHQRVKPADILSTPIIIPSEEVAEVASRQFDALYQQCFVLRTMNAKLAAARDLLLPRLISGRLTLTAHELAADAPALELLAAE